MPRGTRSRCREHGAGRRLGRLRERTPRGAHRVGARARRIDDHGAGHVWLNSDHCEGDRECESRYHWCSHQPLTADSTRPPVKPVLGTAPCRALRAELGEARRFAPHGIQSGGGGEAACGVGRYHRSRDVQEPRCAEFAPTRPRQAREYTGNHPLNAACAVDEPSAWRPSRQAATGFPP
jgi:hypothetical protein